MDATTLHAAARRQHLDLLRGGRPIQPAVQRLSVPPQPQPSVLSSPPCTHRGPRLGQLNCGCQGQPIVYECDLHDRCVSDPLSDFRDGPIVLDGYGQTDETYAPWSTRDGDNQQPLAGIDRIRACGLCPDRPDALLRSGHQRHASSLPSPWSRRISDSPLWFARSIDLPADAARIIPQLPPDLAGVIGIARSGLAPATLIATHLHVPLYTLRNDGQLLDCGHGPRGSTFQTAAGPLLLLDDTAYSGQRMAWARAQLPAHELITAAVYVHDPKHVDLYGCHARHHIVEWNCFNNPALLTGHSAIPILSGGFGFDFDGVLCENPRLPDQPDTPAFLDWIEMAEPLHLPRAARVHLIASGRIEPWRSRSLTWLASHGVQVNRLELQPYASPQERNAAGDTAERKARAYRDSPCTVFVESEPDQCPIIRTVSGKTVLCPRTAEIWHA